MGEVAASNSEEPEKAASSNNHQESEPLFTKIIKDIETEEKLEELAEKLATEWRKPVKTNAKPDLSFSKFQEKLKKNKS